VHVFHRQRRDWVLGRRRVSVGQLADEMPR
jgi:hypothetical protein